MQPPIPSRIHPEFIQMELSPIMSCWEKKEGPVTSGDWYAIYHHLPVVKGASFKPLLLINQWEKDKKNQPKNPSNSSRIDGAFLVMGLLELDSTWRCRLGPVAYGLRERYATKILPGSSHGKNHGKHIGKPWENP